MILQTRSIEKLYELAQTEQYMLWKTITKNGFADKEKEVNEICQCISNIYSLIEESDNERRK